MGRETQHAIVETRGSGIEDYVRADGTVVVPDGVTLTSFLNRNRAAFGEAPSYRFVNYVSDPDGRVIELSWNGLWAQVCAVGARLQQVTSPRDRVAILAPQGVEYVSAFFAAVHAAISPCRCSLPAWPVTPSGWPPCSPTPSAAWS